MQYHPCDIFRSELQQIYEEHCGPLFRQELGTSKPMITFLRLLNIGGYITQAKLHEAPGKQASKIMGKFKQGLDP